MNKKHLSLLLVLLLMFAQVPSVFAAGLKEGGASLLLPTTGQAMNNESGTTKSKIMAGIEIASITAITILGITVGGGVVWAGAGPLLANHLWSATDAYKSAQYKKDPIAQEQMAEAQRMLELSRQKRFEREQTYHSSARDRIMRAGENS